MKNSKRVTYGFVFTVLIFLSLVSCHKTSKQHHYTVEGQLSNSNNEWVMIYKLSPLSVVKLDSAQLDAAGSFEMEFSAPDSVELLLLSVKNYPQRITLLMSAGEKVNIEGDATALNKTYRVSGAKGSVALRQLAHTLNNMMDKADSVYLAFRASKDTAHVKERAAHTDSLLMNIYAGAHDFVKSFCLENSDNLAGVVGLYSKFGTERVLDFDKDFDVFKTVAGGVSRRYPDNEHAADLSGRVNEIIEKKNHLREIEKTLEAGNKAPDLILPTPEGKRLELSAFKGKYLALYFWISKDKDCWDTNEELKSIYKKYKNKNFDILSVSMEKDKLVWVNTIALDRLTWKQVIADENTYKIYNLNDKPRLFLIDPQGLISAKDISADSLNTILSQVLK